MLTLREKGKIFFKNVYVFISREREWEKERIPSRLHTVSPEPDVGLELMNHEIMTRAETKSWTLNQLSHSGAPKRKILNNNLTLYLRN